MAPRSIIESTEPMEYEGPVPIAEWPYAQHMGGLVLASGDYGPQTQGLNLDEAIVKQKGFDELEYIGLLDLQSEAAQFAYDSIMNDPGVITIDQPALRRTSMINSFIDGRKNLYWEGNWKFGSWRVGYATYADDAAKPIATLLVAELDSVPENTALLPQQLPVPEDPEDRGFRLCRLSRTDYPLRRVGNPSEVPEGSIHLQFDDQDWYVDYQSGDGGTAAEVTGMPSLRKLKKAAELKIASTLESSVWGGFEDAYEQANDRDRDAIPETDDFEKARGAFQRSMKANRMTDNEQQEVERLRLRLVYGTAAAIPELMAGDLLPALDYMMSYAQKAEDQGGLPFPYAERARLLKQNLPFLMGLWQVQREQLLPAAISQEIEQALPQLMKTVSLVRNTRDTTAPIGSTAQDPKYSYRAVGALPNGRPSQRYGSFSKLPEPIR